MQYQVTQQYARDDERLVANFVELAAAKAYIADSLVANEQQRLAIVYRLFDSSHCIREYNKAKVGVLLNNAYYADGTRLLPATLKHGYDVVKQTSQVQVMAVFYQLSDARAFMVKCLMDEGHSERAVLYHIIKDKIVIEAMDSAAVAAAHGSGEGGMASNIVFRPTPLNTSPRPPGVPPPSVMNEEEV